MMLLTLKKLIYPRKCIVCRSILLADEESYLCPSCDSGILREHTCPVCSKPYSIDAKSCPWCKEMIPSITRIVALFPYREKYKKAVLRWKYKGIRKYGKGFGKLLSEEKTDLKALNIGGLIPVPISNQRYRDRGFNQALDLANSLSEHLDIPVYDILIREKNTKPQSAFSKQERRKNIRGTIKVSEIPYDIIDKREKINVAIIDDIYTTGSTVEECIRALSEENELLLKEIYVLVVCIGI